MLKRIPTNPGLVFGSFLYRSDLHYERSLLQTWEFAVGDSFVWYPEFNPSLDYYAKEMGRADLLKRFFLVTLGPHPRDLLLEMKLRALAWEESWVNSGRRTVNVDVGYLSLENFLLATTKNYSHRVYLGQDIFADLTYQCQQGQFRTLPWTYPDFAHGEKLQFFGKMRSYLLQLPRRNCGNP